MELTLEEMAQVAGGLGPAGAVIGGVAGGLSSYVGGGVGGIIGGVTLGAVGGFFGCIASATTGLAGPCSEATQSGQAFWARQPESPARNRGYYGDGLLERRGDFFVRNLVHPGYDSGPPQRRVSGVCSWKVPGLTGRINPRGKLRGRRASGSGLRRC